jgi:hypothetical protein
LLLFSICRLILRPQRADACRSRIRKIRDDLFDFMWMNGHDFSNPAYHEARKMLNGMLRLTCVIGPIEFIALLIRCHNEPTQPGSINRLVEGDLKQRLEEATNQATREFLRYLYAEGIIGHCLRLLWVGFIALRLCHKTTQWLMARADLLKGMAIEYGQENLSPRQVALLACSAHTTRY